MSASNLRRRLHHADVDGRKNEHVGISHVDSLDEPLLGKSSYDGGGSEVYDPRRQDLWDDDDRKKEQLHWSFLFSNLIAQWAQWLANIIVSSGSIFGRLFPFSSDNETSNPVYLSPLQEERLDNLRRRLKIPFDGSRIEHQASFQMLLNKVQGQRADWEYPFAVAGRDEHAFDHLYCVAFRMLDAQWLVKRASYMEFNEVMKSTRTQLERELVLEDVLAVKDLPSYTMLDK
ncbi:unnamed protein product [Triticum turgidum subsp. durum]|uniref:ELMO domain-containing protein n=1 Tax=Triticum turgidum subsp. durum TaxID=4567 RepID=A0A9R0T4U1_TRITD|nr:unnamed protein product [Triticum turgidum subsp. durum]